ncbi:hypothetical protein LUU34_01229800 [Aix galericulata]|nr:hypothetical protein LUU34_01229800 [Aix galericulata]
MRPGPVPWGWSGLCCLALPPWGRSSPANICSSSRGPNEWCPCRATTPSPFPKPAQCLHTQLGPALTGPLCPQVLLFLQEKEEENHQASQVSCRGRVERRARGLLSLWPWLDLDLWSRRRRPLGLDGAGAEPAGLPRRPTRRRGAGPPQTACPFLRHSPSAWPFTRTKPDFAEVPASV